MVGVPSLATTASRVLPSGGRDGLIAMQLADAAYESARTGQAVAVAG